MGSTRSTGPWGCQHHGGTYHAKFPGFEGDSDQALPDGASRRLPSGAVVLICSNCLKWIVWTKGLANRLTKGTHAWPFFRVVNPNTIHSMHIYGHSATPFVKAGMTRTPSWNNMINMMWNWNMVQWEFPIAPVPPKRGHANFLGAYCSHGGLWLATRPSYHLRGRVCDLTFEPRWRFRCARRK